jgi:hypothetical protein
MEIETELNVYFGIFKFGDDLSKVTKIIGTEPDKSWIKGEHYSQKFPKAIRTHSRWQLNSGLDKNNSFDEHIAALLKRLEPLRDKIKILSDQFEVGICCAIYTYEANPGIHLSENIVQRIASLGLSIDFDMYCFNEDKE